MVGHARDLYTGDDHSVPQTVSQDSLRSGISVNREVSSITASRCNAEVSNLTSIRLGGAFRKAMAQQMPQEVEHTTLLYRLLDDMVGASLVSNAALDVWGIQADGSRSEPAPADTYDRTGTCISFAPGSRTILPNGQANSGDIKRIAVDVPIDIGDPNAWHPWEKLTGPNQMRLRRTDLWEDGQLLQVNAQFQDSAAFSYTEQRMVFHEYRVEAVIEPDTFVLQSVEVETGILPFTECLQAADTAQKMVGQSLLNFGRSVPAQLPGIAGCTHLNDILRSLQDVVALSEILGQQRR